MELFELTAHEIRDMIKSKQISACDVTQSVLSRINDVESKVESYITILDEEAINNAKSIDKRIASGENTGSLCGIPMAVKDNISTKGILTTCASRMLSNYKPPFTATAVKKLLLEDSILLGKLNMDEFGMGASTKNSAFKKTKNPYDLTKVPGGSSGGSAAAVSSGEAFFSLGTDTGGSIRQPASFCGCVGLKPTYGLVSRYGLIAFASSLDQIGPITKDVTDAAMVLNAIAGNDKKDSTSSYIKHNDYEASLTGNIKNLKIGVPKEFLQTEIDDEVFSCFISALNNMRINGAQYEEMSLFSSKYAVATYYAISSIEAASNLARFDGVKYGFRTESFTDLKSLYSKTRSEGFGEEVKKRVMLGTYLLSSECADNYYILAQKARSIIIKDFEDAFLKYDVLVTPASLNAAPSFDENKSDKNDMYISNICTVAVNLAGLPAIVIPCGYNKEGLPIGIQIIGKPHSESTILNAAYALEKTISKRAPIL